MEIATFVNMMSQEEQKECLKIIAKTNLKLFGDVLVEAQSEEKEKIENAAKKVREIEENNENPRKFDGFLGYSDV